MLQFFKFQLFHRSCSDEGHLKDLWGGFVFLFFTIFCGIAKFLHLRFLIFFFFNFYLK